jgi:hypothetical protein
MRGGAIRLQTIDLFFNHRRKYTAFGKLGMDKAFLNGDDHNKIDKQHGHHQQDGKIRNDFRFYAVKKHGAFSIFSAPAAIRPPVSRRLLL